MQNPVSLLPPNNRYYETFGDLIIIRCLEIIETSENLDEARAKLIEEFEIKEKNDLH